MTTNNSVNNASPNIAAHSVVISEAGLDQVGVLLTSGQVLMGVTGADPVGATVAALAWIVAGAGPLTAAINTGYIIDQVGPTTITLPVAPAIGSVVAIAGSTTGSGGWVLGSGAAQVINFGNKPTSSGGSLTSTNKFDTVEVIYSSASNWTVTYAVGNITYA